MSRPDVSVVVASRRDRLSFTLAALAAQTLASERFEVIVVRDEGLPVVPAPPGLNQRTLARPRSAQGPGAMRDVGWRAARAALVAFTDDDCRPAPDWLEQLLSAAGESTVVQGRTIGDPEQTHLRGGLARTRAVGGADSSFPPCNIAYPRALLERVDGFDDCFPDALGEGTDLALRAFAAGAEHRFAADALVWHGVLPRSLPVALREALRWRSRARVLARHAEDRRALRLGIFVSRTHAAVPPLLLGLALARRHRPLGALLALPYIVARGRLAPQVSARELASLPAWAVVDSVEVGATVAGAVRERTPVV